MGRKTLGDPDSRVEGRKGLGAGLEFSEKGAGRFEFLSLREKGAWDSDFWILKASAKGLKRLENRELRIPAGFLANLPLGPHLLAVQPAWEM